MEKILSRLKEERNEVNDNLMKKDLEFVNLKNKSNIIEVPGGKFILAGSLK